MSSEVLFFFEVFFILEFGILAAFGAMLAWGIGDFLIQRSIRTVGTMESVAFIGLIGAIALFPFVLQELPLLFSLPNIAFLCFVGITNFFFTMFDFEALKKGKLSVIQVIFVIELPLAAIFGFLFFQETLSLLQIFLIALILFGLVFVSVSQSSKKNSLAVPEKGVFFAIIASVGMALLGFFTAIGSKQVSPILIVWAPWLTFAIISLFFIWKRNGLKRFYNNAKKFKLLIVSTGAFTTLAWLLFATAVFDNKLAIVSAISGSYPAIDVFLGLLVNKEAMTKIQILGAILALAAAFLLALFL